MPRGVYKRTPEHNAANSKSKKGISRTPEHNAANSKSKKGIPKSPEHGAAISKAKLGVSLPPRTPKHCNNISKSKTGVPNSPEHNAAISEGMRESDAVKANIDTMCGGDDIANHHYIYDHSDLSKYIMRMARSAHTRLHNNMRKAGIKVPHINIEETENE